MVEHDEARARPERALERCDAASRVVDRRRPRHGLDDRAALGGVEGDGARHAAVGMVGDDDLVARREGDRAQHRVDAGARVVDERQRVAAAAEEGADARRGRAQARRRAGVGGRCRRRGAQVRQLAQHEARRMALDLVEQREARLHHRVRRDADRAVVQVHAARLRAGTARAGSGRSAARASGRQWNASIVVAPISGSSRRASGRRRRVARRDLVRVGEEARQVGAVRGLAVAVLQAREDAEHLQVALQADPFDAAPELAEVGRHRQPRLARRFPVADRPVELLLLVPRDEGVAQQRGDVVADRPGDGVLEVEDARVRIGDHQVPRHPVAVNGDDRLRQRGGDELVAGLVPGRLFRRAPGDAAFARHAPVGKERELAAQQRVVVRRQRRRRHLELPGDEGGDRVAHQAVGAAQVAARLRRLQRLEIELAAEVVEEEKAVRPCRPRGRAGACRPAAAIRPATWTNGRTSSCGGGASMTMTLPPASRSARK